MCEQNYIEKQSESDHVFLSIKKRADIVFARF